MHHTPTAYVACQFLADKGLRMNTNLVCALDALFTHHAEGHPDDTERLAILGSELLQLAAMRMSSTPGQRIEITPLMLRAARLSCCELLSMIEGGDDE